MNGMDTLPSALGSKKECTANSVPNIDNFTLSDSGGQYSTSNQPDNHHPHRVKKKRGEKVGNG